MNNAHTASGPTLTPEEVHKRLTDMEERYNLLRFRIDGWCAWPLMRFSVAQHIQNLPLAPRPDSKVPARAPRMMQLLQHVARPGGRTILINTYASSLTEKNGEQYEDIFFDTLIRSREDCLKIEWMNNPAFAQHSARAAIPAALHVRPNSSVFHWMADIAARDPAIRKLAAEIYACLEQEPAFHLNVYNITGFLARFRCSRRLHTLLFRIVRPRAVLTAHPEAFGLNAAARALHIPVAEVQHGFIDRLHYSYSWSAYAKAHKAHIALPRKIFLYGEHWKQELLQTGFWEEEDLRITGNMRMDTYRTRRRERKAGEPLRIVFTTQGMNIPQTTAFIRQTLAMVSDIPLQLVIKLHPVYDRDAAPYIAAFGTDARVTVVRGDDDPSTYDILSRSDLHISISSTCHYEALALGVPTVILPFATYEDVLHLQKDAHAALAHTPADVAGFIRNGRPAVPPHFATHYFMPGAAALMDHELQALCSA